MVNPCFLIGAAAGVDVGGLAAARPIPTVGLAPPSAPSILEGMIGLPVCDNWGLGIAGKATRGRGVAIREANVGDCICDLAAVVGLARGPIDETEGMALPAVAGFGRDPIVGALPIVGSRPIVGNLPMVGRAPIVGSFPPVLAELAVLPGVPENDAGPTVLGDTPVSPGLPENDAGPTVLGDTPVSPGLPENDAGPTAAVLSHDFLYLIPT